MAWCGNTGEAISQSFVLGRCYCWLSSSDTSRYQLSDLLANKNSKIFPGDPSQEILGKNFRRAKTFSKNIDLGFTPASYY